MTSFITNRSLLNPKFEGYKFHRLDESKIVSRHKLPYPSTQSKFKNNSLFSFAEVESRISHNHLTVCPDESYAVYVDNDFRVVLVRVDEADHPPSFRCAYELPRPAQSPESASYHPEYPSSSFPSSGRLFLTDGMGMMYDFEVAVDSTLRLASAGPIIATNGTPFRIHSSHITPLGAYVAVLSYRNYSGTADSRKPKFDICAIVKQDSDWQLMWKLQGPAVPSLTSYAESLGAFYLVGSAPYEGYCATPVETLNDNVTTNTLSVVHEVDGKNNTVSAPPPYSWTQTEDSLTIAIPLPSATSKNNISLVFAPRSLTLRIFGEYVGFSPPEYHAKELWDAISPSTSYWTWDKEGERSTGVLTLYLDKRDEGTKWMHVFSASGTSEGEDVPETLDPSELYLIRESLEKYTASLRSGEDVSGLGLGSGVPSLAKGEVDEEVDSNVGKISYMTWVYEDGTCPKWAPPQEQVPFQLLSVPLPGRANLRDLIIKSDVDGPAFELETPVNDSPRWKHWMTYPALAFVLASKRDLRFTYHTDTAVLGLEYGLRNVSCNIYIYVAPKDLTSPWARQSILNISSSTGGPLVGVGAIRNKEESIILALMENELVLIRDKYIGS